MNHVPRPYGAALILGVALLLVSTVAYLTAGEGVNHGIVGGTIGVWSCFAWVIGAVGLARTFEPRAPRLAPTLAVLSVVGLMTGYGYNVEAIHLEHLGADIWSEDFENPLGYLAFDPWGLCVPLSLLLTAFLVWRTGLYPRLLALPLLLGGLLFIPSREAGVDGIAVVADLLLVAGLAPLGLAMLAGDGAGATRVPRNRVTVG